MVPKSIRPLFNEAKPYFMHYHDNAMIFYYIAIMTANCYIFGKVYTETQELYTLYGHFHFGYIAQSSR